MDAGMALFVNPCRKMEMKEGTNGCPFGEKKGVIMAVMKIRAAGRGWESRDRAGRKWPADEDGGHD